MNRDNIGLIVGLQPKDGTSKSKKPTVFIANTHILFNKNRGDIKLLQLAKLLSEIEELSKVTSHLPEKATAEDIYNPIIICGDFNSTPSSPLYDFATRGKLTYEGLSRVHISGQNSPMRHADSRTYIKRLLIPEEMHLTNLCQKATRNDTHLTGSSCNFQSNSARENDECLIVGEIIAGKTVIMEEPGVLKHLLRLQSAYQHIEHKGKSAVTSAQGTVDYILFSPGMERSVSEKLCNDGDIFVEVPRKQLYLTGVLTLLSNDELMLMNSFPNPVLSSDHLALLATFRLLE